MLSPLRLDYEPIEQWSPSSLSMARSSLRMYLFRYGAGIKEQRFTIEEAEAMPEPPKATRGASSVERERAKQARKAWNKIQRPALGHRVHEILQARYEGRDLGLWETRAGQIAISGLGHLPAPDGFIQAACEQRCEIDQSALLPPGEAPVEINAFKDLVVRWIINNEVRLYDFKTTFSFDYCKTEEQLLEDEQVNLYALDVCQRFNLTDVKCTWVYFRTEGPPASKAVSVVVTRAAAEAYVRVLLAEAVALRAELRALPRNFDERIEYINRKPCDPSLCETHFGGCHYRPVQGGPCTPPKLTSGQQWKADNKRRLQMAARKEANRSSTSAVTYTPRTRGSRMALSEAQVKGMSLEELKALTGDDVNFLVKRQIAALEKAAKAAGGGGETPPAEKPPVETTGEAAPEEKPASDKPAKPAKAAPAKSNDHNSVADHQGITVTNGGITFEVPRGSPLYKPLLEAAKAQRAFAVALSGGAQ